MKKTLLPNLTAEVRHRVVTENLVSFRHPGAPPVLCSPWLLEVLETAAWKAVEPHLDAGEITLGVAFDFQHLAPTPCGDTIVATARVTAVDDGQITFEIEAHDSYEPVARGKHVRAIVNRQRFDERLKSKSR